MADIFGFSNVKGTSNKNIITAGDSNSVMQIQVDFSEITQLFAIYNENGTIARGARAAINRAFKKMATTTRTRLKANTNKNKFDNRRSGRNLTFRRKVIVPYAARTAKDRSHITSGNPQLINRFNSDMTKGVDITQPTDPDKNKITVQIGWDPKATRVGNNRVDLRHIPGVITGKRFSVPRDVLTLTLNEVEKNFDDILNKEMNNFISSDSISPFSATGKGASLSVGLNDLGFQAAQGIGDFISGV